MKEEHGVKMSEDFDAEGNDMEKGEDDDNKREESKEEEMDKQMGH